MTISRKMVSTDLGLTLTGLNLILSASCSRGRGYHLDTPLFPLLDYSTADAFPRGRWNVTSEGAPLETQTENVLRLLPEIGRQGSVFAEHMLSALDEMGATPKDVLPMIESLYSGDYFNRPDFDSSSISSDLGSGAVKAAHLSGLSVEMTVSLLQDIRTSAGHWTLDAFRSLPGALKALDSIEGMDPVAKVAYLKELAAVCGVGTCHAYRGLSKVLESGISLDVYKKILERVVPQSNASFNQYQEAIVDLPQLFLGLKESGLSPSNIEKLCMRFVDFYTAKQRPGGYPPFVEMYFPLVSAAQKALAVGFPEDAAAAFIPAVCLPDGIWVSDKVKKLPAVLDILSRRGLSHSQISEFLLPLAQSWRPAGSNGQSDFDRYIPRADEALGKLSLDAGTHARLLSLIFQEAEAGLFKLFYDDKDQPLSGYISFMLKQHADSALIPPDVKEEIVRQIERVLTEAKENAGPVFKILTGSGGREPFDEIVGRLTSLSRGELERAYPFVGSR